MACGIAIIWMRGEGMHFEILVEDQSGKVALDILMPNIIGSEHTFCVRSYKGVGRIPKKMHSAVDASKRQLLTNLPRLLAGYGKSWPKGYGAVIVVCDLDDNCMKEFRGELLQVLDACNPRPDAKFCIAIEEGEAWFLGDVAAVKQAYPKAKDSVLNEYVNDSICGTWERLADAVYKGGSPALSKQGWQVAGAEKTAWAENIAPHMKLDINKSPSFNYFLAAINTLSTNSM